MLGLRPQWTARIVLALLTGGAAWFLTTDFAAAAPPPWPTGGAWVVGGLTLLVASLIDGVAVRLPVTDLVHRCQSRPHTFVVAVAVLGSLAAAHPLLLGRSLVSPNTGGAAMLYDAPPFLPGSEDLEVETARGSDIGAMMWAILPYTIIQRQAFAQGEWPLWNRYNTIGEPLWGQAQTFALDPIHVVSLAIPDIALAMDLRFVAARTIFAVGIGLVILALTGSASAAALVALLTPFVGYYTMRLNHPAYFSLTYAPWILLAFVSLARADDVSRRWRAVAWLAVASVLQLVSSTPKEGASALVAAYLAGLAALMWSRHSWRDRLRAMDGVAIGGAAFVLASAPHWLIFLDTLSRAFTVYDRPLVMFAGRADVPGIALGATAPGTLLPGVNAAIAALVIAGLLGLVVRRLSALTAGVAVCAIAMLALAFGVVPASVLTRVPLLANVHHLGLAATAASVPLLLIVAGGGAAMLMDASTPRRVRSLSVLLAAVAAAVVGRQLLVQPLTVHSAASLLAGGGGVAVVVLLIQSRRATTGASAAALALAIVICAGAGGLWMTTPSANANALLVQPRPRVSLTTPPAEFAPLSSEHAAAPFRVAPLGSMMIAGTQGLWGLEGIDGPDAVRLNRVEDLSDLAGIHRTSWMWRTILEPAALSSAKGFLDMVGVRYLVGPGSGGPDRSSATPSDRLRLVSRSSAWPRAFFVDGVQRHQSAIDLSDRLRTARQPFASVQASDAAAVEGSVSLPSEATTVAPARDYQLTVNRTTFVVDAPGPGMVVLAEAFVDRDFRATLNGAAVAYYRVNHALKGIVIPSAGTWVVAFEYRPALWTWAWVLSVVGWLGIAGLFVAGRRRASAEPGSAAVESLLR